MSARSKRHYTIMFVPDDNSRTFSIKLNKAIVRSMLFFVIVFSIGTIFLIASRGTVALKLQMVDSILEEKARLEEENRNLLQTIDKLNKIRELGSYVQRLAAATVGDTTLQHASSIDSGSLVVSDFLDQEFSSTPMPVTEDFWEAAPNILPVDGWLTRSFVDKDSTAPDYHPGVDFAAATATPIRATAPGIITDVQQHPHIGLLIVIAHGLGFTTKYGHCSQALVFPGQHVSRGQTIALVGNTGRSSAPHLHYEVIKDGRPIDPFKYTLQSVRSRN